MFGVSIRVGEKNDLKLSPSLSILYKLLYIFKFYYYSIIGYFNFGIAEGDAVLQYNSSLSTVQLNLKRPYERLFYEYDVDKLYVSMRLDALWFHI